MSRGWQGAVLKLLRAGDYRLTVTGRCEISQHYLRLSFDGGGLLTDRPLHPTMWIRMWFADGDKLHQRGYTLVDPTRPPTPSTLSSPCTTAWPRAGRRRRSPATPSTRRCWAATSRCPSRAGRLRHRRRHRLASGDQLAARRDRRRAGPGVRGGRARRRQGPYGSPQRGHHLGGPRGRRPGPGGGGQLVGVRRVGSLRLGRLRQPAPPARWPASSARTTKIPRKSVKAQAYWVA